MELVNKIYDTPLPNFSEYISTIISNEDYGPEGVIAEKYVREWLSNCDDLRINSIIMEGNSRIYLLKRRSRPEYYFVRESDTGGVLIEKKSRTLHELDIVVEDSNGNFYIGEVKHGALNGYAKKIPKILDLGLSIWGKNFRGILLFTSNQMTFENIIEKYRGKKVYPVYFPFIK